MDLATQVTDGALCCRARCLRLMGFSRILLRISAAAGALTPRDVAARHGVRPGRLYADSYCICSRR